MEGGDKCQELWREANRREDLEEPASAHQVEGFSKVHEGEEQWLLQRSTLLQLTEGENHVHCGPPGSKITLRLGVDSHSEALQAGQGDPSKDCQ